MGFTIYITPVKGSCLRKYLYPLGSYSKAAISKACKGDLCVKSPKVPSNQKVPRSTHILSSSEDMILHDTHSLIRSQRELSRSSGKV